MSRVILVCGPTGAGKTTYSIGLSRDIAAVRFSIDPWMQTLFAKDMVSLDYEWMIERVGRCCEQIWNVSEQIVGTQGSVVLDLGFTERSQRAQFVERARTLGIQPEVHYIKAAGDLRRKRVAQRNSEKDPDVYAFEVTDFMFDFMEKRFEVPDTQELENGCTVEMD